MAESHAHARARLVSETRRRFEAEYVAEKPDKYDPRDVERLRRDDSWVESYLCWRHHAVDDALRMLDESLQWRKEIGVHDLTESSIPRWLLELGGVYLHGYDREGNKLFWIRVKYHVKDQRTILEKKKLIAFWLERYARREHGKPVTVMFDLSDTGLNSIDMDFVRFIINCFKVYYPKYLSKIVIFDMPWIMNAAFKIVKSWLGPEAVSLLKFTSKNEVQDYVSVEYLPPHMGGTDPFRYSYPPLVDDDFQTPLCENGPVASEDETSSREDVDSDGKETLDAAASEEHGAAPKKLHPPEPTPKGEENDKGDSKVKSFKKPSSVFKGPLLHVSPAEELHFGSTESGEKRTLIVLTNVTKNIVAFKVRTTAPDKYRVKPSNSSCEPGASVDIAVSPHGGFVVSAQDRFLIMAAEMEQPCGTGPAELTQFWKEVPRNKVMEHRLRCHSAESGKPNALALRDSALNTSEKTGEDMYVQLHRLLESNRRLEEHVRRCVRLQQLLLCLSLLVLAAVVSLFCSRSG